MRYQLLIKRQAKKTLQSLSRPDKSRITEKIMALRANADNPAHDIMPLQGQPYFRLRVGSWRIIYDRDEQVKIIAIEKISPRGGAYK